VKRRPGLAPKLVPKLAPKLAIGAAAALLFATASPARAQAVPGALPGAEGPLVNDSWLPVNAAAAERLAQGDQAWARSLEGAGDRELTLVLESWHAALELSTAGDSVPPRPQARSAAAASPWPDPDGTADRRIEGVEVAVLRRLTALPEAARRAWSERFAGLARKELASAGRDATALAKIERAHPATEAAALAALKLGELALEEGRYATCRTWLARGQRHVELAGLGGSELETGIASRRRACPSEPAPQDGAWDSAMRLEPLGSNLLESDLRGKPIYRPLLDRSVQNGLCFLEDGRALVQSASRVHVLEPERGATSLVFEPARLVAPAGWRISEPSPPREPPGWPLVPASDGRSILLVAGRSTPGEPNALVCVKLEPSSSTPGLSVPRLVWAVRGTERLDGAGRLATNELGHFGNLGDLGEPGEAGEGAPLGEFQPGPLIVGSLAIAQVRDGPPAAGESSLLEPRAAAGSEVRCWLAAFDLETGELRWRRLLAKGVELSRSSGRFASAVAGSSASQPLARAGEGVFASTQIGAGVLVDAADGRLAWSLKNRRRSAEQPGWPGWQPPVDVARDGAPAILWASADSDFLYWVRAEPDLGGQGLFVHPPRAIGEAEALVGGSGGEALVLSRSGRERTLSAWNGANGRRYDAPWIGPREVFTGSGAVSPGRVCVASDRGVYLFDRVRDLYLLDYEPLEAVAAPGGSVHVQGDRIWVVGPQAVWLFKAVP
jgi:hypothetical protein